MATGRAEGPNAMIDAITCALSNVLLETSGIDGAKSVLLNIRGASKNLKTKQLETVEALVTQNVDNVAKIFAGIDNTDEIGEEVCVTLIATGFPDETQEKQKVVEEAPVLEVKDETPPLSNPIEKKPVEALQEELSFNGEFISGSEWGKVTKGKQPQLSGLNARNSRVSYEQAMDNRVGNFDFRDSSLPSDSELEMPAYYRHIKR